MAVTLDQIFIKQAFVAIAVRQWDVMVLFYQYFFNQAPQPHSPNSYAEFQVGGIKIGLFEPNPSHQAEFSAPERAAISVCLEVSNLEQSRAKIDAAYDAIHRAVENNTLQGDWPPRFYGDIAIASHGRECYAYDPDGNRLILHEGH